MTTLRLIVAGPRTWTDANTLGEALYGAINETDATEITIVHGACPEGADHLTSEFCESEAEWFDGAGRRLTEEPHPADWDMCGVECSPRPHRIRKRPGDVVHPGQLPDYCPGAGPRRNRLVAGLGGGLLVAFIEPCANPRCRAPRPHDSHGTAGMIRLCKRAGIPVRPVRAAVPLRAPS